MTQTLDDRRAVVTGSGRGIGRAIALRLAHSGAQVVVCARTVSEIDETVQLIRDSGGIAFGLQVDITSDESVEKFVRAASDATGGPIDTLVNNAGAYRAHLFAELSMTEWNNLFEVNVFGLVRVTRSFLPEMLNLSRARIINLASIAGKKASFGQSAYNASKHAQIGITRCLALELGHTNIRVNAVCPGFTPTSLIDIDNLAEVHNKPADQIWNDISRSAAIGRVVTVDEIAGAVHYLATSAADGVTGQSLVVDGGVVYS